MNNQSTQRFLRGQYALIVAMLFVCFLTATTSPVVASVRDDLDRLEQVVAQTINRLESGIELKPRVNSDFSKKARLQFELAALADNQQVVLEEDFFNLGQSLIARHFCNYDSAKGFLQKELDTQKNGVISSWLRKEIAELELLGKKRQDTTESTPHEPPCSYREIIKDLQRTLTKAGIR